MTSYRVAEAADLIGVSYDTLRRWVESGRVKLSAPDSFPHTIEGSDLAKLAKEVARLPQEVRTTKTSARNRATGLVTRVLKEGLMAQVDVQCGPFRFVSLMSREAAEELALEVGDRAVVVVKATNVIIER